MTATPARALAVYAHPDDPEVSCGGTLARWSDAGADVQVVIATQGDKGTHDPGGDPAELAARRAEEVAAAAAVLGATAHLLGIPDGEIDNTPELRSRLVAVVRQVRPEVVVAPDPTAVFFGDSYVNHHDHRELGWAVLDAVAPAAAFPLYFPDAGPPHQVEAVYLSGTLEPDCFVDIGATLDRKVEALRCHRSQLGGDGADDDEGAEWVADLLEHRALDAGRRAGVRHAEGFRRLRLSG